MYKGEDIAAHRAAIAENISKGFASDEDDLEKARQDGEAHPSKPWVWRASANGGKGDWRSAGKGAASGGGEASGRAGADKPAAKTGGKSEAYDQGLLNTVIDKIQVSSNKYTDPSKLTFAKTPKGNLRVYYDNKDTGLTLDASSLPTKAVNSLLKKKQDVDSQEGNDAGGNDDKGKETGGITPETEKKLRDAGFHKTSSKSKSGETVFADRDGDRRLRVAPDGQVTWSQIDDDTLKRFSQKFSSVDEALSGGRRWITKQGESDKKEGGADDKPKTVKQKNAEKLAAEKKVWERKPHSYLATALGTVVDDTKKMALQTTIRERVDKIKKTINKKFADNNLGNINFDDHEVTFVIADPGGNLSINAAGIQKKLESGGVEIHGEFHVEKTKGGDYRVTFGW